MFTSSSSSSTSIRVNLNQHRSIHPTASSRSGETAATSTSTSFPVSTTASNGGGGVGGVVVVGFVGSRPTTDATHLINTIVDANIFGSGDDDKAKDLPPFPLKHHRISYYYRHDASSSSSDDNGDEKGNGLLFLLLSPSSPSSPSVFLAETFESDHLRGMLFMFSVCHVIVFLHEGLRFDTEILKKFRLLQAAKHALSPFIRSQITPMSLPQSSNSTSPSQPNTTPSPSSISLPGRRTCRHSSISLMSGSGLRTSTLPGYCSPVILFVFSYDSSDGINSSDMDDLTDGSFLSQPSSGNTGSHKPPSVAKAPGPVVMLARPIGKAEGSLKKKLQISLDAQIRFLIKKCRILVGAEPGLRGTGSTNAIPLFSLDTSRVVVLIDRSVSQRCEALDFITGLIDDDFNYNGPPDVSMFGTQCQALNHEEIQMIRDCIYRQSDTLRGRVGILSNANCGSVAGVGMVAVAAAAAAVSAAAGKPISARELPSLENWLFSSILIISTLFSLGHEFMDASGKIKMTPLQSSVNEILKEQTSRVGSSVAEPAMCYLESSMCLNMKFSVSWCKRALPVAKEVYLKDLPPCYPSSLHDVQLEKALNAFRSMVKGPAVQTFTKKLEEECTCIWTSERQLCDAISLTGNPCIHQRHAVTGCGSSFRSVKEHSSGYFFHHACACGRSRRLREDPFDIYSATVNFNCFSCSEAIIPTVVFPKGSNSPPLPPSSWRLLRLGGARLYEPSKGLLQTGFCSGENFLQKWTLSIEKQKGAHALSTGVAFESSVGNSTPEPMALAVSGEEKKELDIGKFSKGVQVGDLVNRRQLAETVSSADTNISFGKGLPSFTMRKPFAEVVAGTIPMDSTVSHLKHNKQQTVTIAKCGKQMGDIDQNYDQVDKADDYQQSHKTEVTKLQESSQSTATDHETSCDPFLQIGSNLVPVNTSNSGNLLPKSLQKQVTMYVGFEHECSYGHRFLLSPKHLMEIDSSHSTEVFERRHAKSSNVLHEKVLPSPFRKTTTVNDRKRSNKSTERDANGTLQRDRFNSFTREGTGNFQSVPGFSISSIPKEDIEDNILHGRLDDGDSAFTLLNRNLPIYMKCPHCKSSTKKNLQEIKFASTVSQLQRIFLVTPPLPTVLATCPIIQFEEQCVTPSTLVPQQKLCFTLGSRVILPPESFLVLRLPFIFGVQKGDGSLQPLNHIKDRPELSAWLLKCTTLQVVSMEHETSHAMKK